MGLGLLLVTALAAIVSTADCHCASTTLYANTSTSTHTVGASAYSKCQIKIQPSSQYANISIYYYLEISWTSQNYNITGNMPLCQEAHMKVFVTRDYKSVGRFCSSNTGVPFTMYSRDGHAKIVLSVGSYGSGAVTFNYKLKAKHTHPLGGSLSDSICHNTHNYQSSGVIYSSGWPQSYKQFSSSCSFKIEKSYGYRGIQVVFMDFNLHSSDCVQLYGSNYSSNNNDTALFSPLCGSVNITKYNVYSKYVKIKFDRQKGGNYGTHRGFVAGYIMYGTLPTTPSPSSSPSPSTTLPTTKPANSAVYETHSSSFLIVAVVLGVLFQ